MRFWKIRSGRLLTALAVVGAFLLGGATYGAVVNAGASGANTTYYACLYGGLLSQVGTTTPKCSNKSAKVISWNSIGPQGPPGRTLFSVSPNSLNFGSIPVDDQSSGKIATVTNVSGVTQYLASSGFSYGESGVVAGVFGLDNKCSETVLAPGASCSLVYTFTPSADATSRYTDYGNIDGQTLSVELTGTGTGTGGSPHMVLSTSSINFGSVQVGTTSAPQPVTVTNTGAGGTFPPSVYGEEALPDTLFGGMGGSCPKYINAGQSCTVASVVFTPTADGSVTGSEPMSGLGSDVAVALSGTGTG